MNERFASLRMDAKGIQIGEPLKEFQGVLMGVPTFHGKMEHLLMEGAE